MSETRLCALDQILPEQSAGFNVDFSGRTIAVFAVRKGDDVFVYENECPHLLTPLNAFGDEYLNDEGTHIECGTHMAQFNIENGLCIEGPCEGDKLTQINAEIRGGDVYLLPT